MPKWPDLSLWADGIKQGNRAHLGRAISLIESSLENDNLLAEQLFERLGKPENPSFRIGITGVPGAGKSTFIEQLGLFITQNLEQKIAVLAIDPSSPISGGSILGDKTRMNDLARDPLAFIRPSPSGGSLGGVAKRTLETIRLCEFAGYNYIFIETVGIGQSEAVVKKLSDLLLLLLITGAGDQLQGIKRGIMELADLILINKADGENLLAAKRAVSETNQAVRLLTESESGWNCKVSHCSSMSQKDMERVWIQIKDYFQFIQSVGWFEKNRIHQSHFWLYTHLEERLKRDLMGWISTRTEAKSLLNSDSAIEEPFVLSRKLYAEYKGRTD
jgi:LAO/AO transport system kinase